MNKNLNLKKSIALASMVLFALIISACGPTATNTTNTNTESKTSNASTPAAPACDDAKIQRHIRDKAEANPSLKKIILQLNAYSKDCKVSLMGYTDTLENFKAFYNIAAETPHVVQVNIDKLFLAKQALDICAEGWEKCGEICVPVGQCWWGPGGKPDATADMKTSTNTNTNANSNSNSNKAKP